LGIVVLVGIVVVVAILEVVGIDSNVVMVVIVGIDRIVVVNFFYIRDFGIECLVIGVNDTQVVIDIFDLVSLKSAYHTEENMVVAMKKSSFVTMG
ncbi:hypothetical protein Tco_0819255, partial [Tanacetum coccineum]